MYETTSRFTEHGPCDNCGSRDNVAWYSNGTGYCFGCGKFHRDSHKILRTNATKYETDGEEPVHCSERVAVCGESLESKSGVRPPPDDLGTYYPTVVIEWMKQYGFTVTDFVKHNVKWSPKREQLVYLFYGEGTDVVLWQARNFRAGTTHKDRFFTGGLPERVIAAYYPEQGAGKTAVVVEGCADALQLAKSGYTGVPVFGAKMSGGKLTRICNMFEEVIWWLDSDKFSEAVKQSNLCKLMNVKSRVINTAYDPKEYTKLEMIDTLMDMRHR